jgi:hypothetical protein
VGNFTDYFLPGSTASQSDFNRDIDKLALYMFFLFLGRLVLNSINKVSKFSAVTTPDGS